MAGGERRFEPICGAGAEELEGPTPRLVDLIRLALAAMTNATAALFGRDQPAVDDDLRAAYEASSKLRHELEEHAAVLLGARSRSTVAELPATVAAVHINAEAEHLGQLAQEVADIARTRRAWASIPAPLLRVLRELSEVGLDTAAKAADVVESRGTVGVAGVDRGDEVNRLGRLLYQQLLYGSAGIEVHAAIDLTLAARCYERYAEHAVAVALRAALLAGAPRN